MSGEFRQVELLSVVHGIVQGLKTAWVRKYFLWGETLVC